MTVTVNINGLDPMEEAVNRLAQAMGAGGVSAGLRMGGADSPAAATGAVPPAAGCIQGGAPVAAMPPTGIPAGMPTSPAAEPGLLGGAPPVPGQIPTTAVSQGYSQDQIAVAMTGLVDQGKQTQVMQILAQFGASSLMQVPKGQYPALATQLRMLGANL